MKAAKTISAMAAVRARVTIEAPIGKTRKLSGIRVAERAVTAEDLERRDRPVNDHCIATHAAGVKRGATGRSVATVTDLSKK